jgi:hypothetical protein
VTEEIAGRTGWSSAEAPLVGARRQLARAGISVFLAAAGAAPAAAQEARVFVVGALGALHDREAAFDFDVLDRVIRAIDPDVMLLEVTPEELAGRVETRGRPEYPRVVWPLIEEAGAPTAFPMEAGEPLYDSLIAAAGSLWSAYGRDRPSENEALEAWEDATSEVLLAHWRSPEDTQDEVTDALARARDRIRAGLLPAGDAIQARWDGEMVHAVRAAISANPGARILVLGSYRNRFMFVDMLSSFPGVAVVDMERWLRSNGFGG